MKKMSNPNEPFILRMNLKFQKPAHTVAQRRKNEALRVRQVHKYLLWLGFSTIVGNDTITGVKVGDKNIKVYFLYRESETDIQRLFSVHINGNKSNITSLRKLYSKR